MKSATKGGWREMKKGPSRWRPEPRVLRAMPYCFVCAASEVDDGWLLEAEDDGWVAEAVLAGWFDEAELEAWLVEADEAGWLADAVDAGWFAEAEDEGWFADAELDGWLAEADVLLEAEPSMPATCTPAALAWSMAACVRGPLTPSTGPGSKPLSFSACWSWRTDSSPLAWLPEALALVPFEAEAELVPFEPLVEPEAIEEDDGWLVEAEDEGWFVDAGWLAEAEADGWLVEADDALLSAAITEPAAIRAAARASFLNFMDCVLSYGQLTAVRFGPNRAGKLHRTAAPSDARRLTAMHGGAAT
jgi:hypothetical protein